MQIGRVEVGNEFIGMLEFHGGEPREFSGQGRVVCKISVCQL